MKSIKIAMITLIVTVGIVASFAFTSKPYCRVDYAFTPGSSLIVVESGLTGSLDPAELNSKDIFGVPDQWTLTSIQTGISSTHKLMGMSFDADELSLADAADAVYAYYISHSNPNKLPLNGAQIPVVTGCGIIYITIYRRN